MTKLKPALMGVWGGFVLVSYIFLSPNLSFIKVIFGYILGFLLLYGCGYFFKFIQEEYLK